MIKSSFLLSHVQQEPIDILLPIDHLAVKPSIKCVETNLKHQIASMRECKRTTCLNDDTIIEWSVALQAPFRSQLAQLWILHLGNTISLPTRYFLFCVTLYSIVQSQFFSEKILWEILFKWVIYYFLTEKFYESERFSFLSAQADVIHYDFDVFVWNAFQGILIDSQGFTETLTTVPIQVMLRSPHTRYYEFGTAFNKYQKNHSQHIGKP